MAIITISLVVVNERSYRIPVFSIKHSVVSVTYIDSIQCHYDTKYDNC